MTIAEKRLRTMGLRREIIIALADVYLFPQTGRGLASGLKDRFSWLDADRVEDCLSYLAKKGYVEIIHGKDGAGSARITAMGIDLAEGAATCRGVLSFKHDPARLSVKREIRFITLSYCRRFPDSFNGDDEILMELVQRGMTALTIDELRYHVWYLSRKGYLEMKTYPLQRDMVFLGRITARGIDLLEGSLTDAGVTIDG